MSALGPLSRDQLAFPASEPLQDRGLTPPIAVSTSMSEQVGDLLPAPPGGSLEREGLGKRLTGYRQPAPRLGTSFPCQHAAAHEFTTPSELDRHPHGWTLPPELDSARHLGKAPQPQGTDLV
jgi:hypothetical protein